MIDFILHIDKHIWELIRQYGPQTYGILALIVFCETGLVVTPFLPGDSLLFAVGIFCNPAKGAASLNFGIMFLVFMLAALAGDNVNYFLGRTFGHKLFRNENSKIFKKSHITKTHEFFEKHGKKTIVLARFVPIVRTFAPFVAGMGEMPYRVFLSFSIFGALLWVGIFLTAGYFFGQVPWVEKNFSIAILAMVLVTAAPLAWEIWRGTKEAKAKAAQEAAQAAVPAEAE